MTQVILRKWFTHCNSRVSDGGAGDHGVEACVLYSNGAAAGKSFFLRNSNCGECESAELLKFLGGGVVADQIFKDGQDVLSIADDGLQDGTKLGLAHRFAVPFSENRCGDLNVLAQLFGRMATQEQAVKKRSLTLRELEIIQRLL
jgi:hypothetical protein